MRFKRNICFITGSRAEYGLLKPIMEEVKKDEKLRFQLVVTGMHLDSQFGMTVNDIVQDGFKIDAKVQTTSNEDTAIAMASSVGIGIIKLVEVLSQIKPEIVVILGDRTEVLSAAVATSYSNIPLAHIHGGDSANAGLDENTRHAITKISHIHFPASLESAERIIKMGEEKWRIHVIGAPGLDDIMKGNFTSKEEIFKKFKLKNGEPVIVLVQHPVTTEVAQASDQMRVTLDAIAQLGFQTVIIYPNSDAGGRAMIKIIEDYLTKYPFIQGYKSIPRPDYLGLLNITNVLVGNSSSGIIETPSFKLPVVNIGIRQEGRQQSSNLIHVGHNTKEIEKAIHIALSDKKFLSKVKRCKNPYWYGGAGEKVAQVLAKLQINAKLLKKKITY